MTCPICGADELRPGKTIFAADVDGTVVVVRDVPADICDVCGEEFIDDKTAADLERSVVDARSGGTETLVRHHEAAGA
jgi:YgiT-type zinc finger domain-containing protein